jgi:uncharacterized protein (TIGR02172 family)
MEMDGKPVALGAPIGIGRTAEVYGWGEGQVLKLYRADMPAEWVAHEASVARIVADAGLAAPAVGELIEVDGRVGIVYERISGPSMLDALARQPWTLGRHARQFAELHAGMHATSRPELPSARESLLRALRAAPRLPEPTRRSLLDALATLPDGDAVCHGDFHPDNIVISSRGPVVIDWMTVTRGNPAADVARTVLLFRAGVLPEGTPAGKRIATEFFRRAFLSAYLRAYRALRPLPDAEIDAWLPLLAAARLNERILAEQKTLLRLAAL